ncbi:MAG TPA: pseudouridine synthase [Terriglobia bacterium]|nr:pseudouridine synthase [Terriglobia bacterium]
MQERLQKILAHAGIASRRQAEVLMREGRVTVNGAPVMELGAKADPATDVITVDGRKIRPPARMIYVLLNKPKNVMSTSRDPEGRPTVMEYVRGEFRERVYPVGRLDFASEGLIILTNDGEFTRFMTQAGTAPKVYRVKVSGRPAERDLDRLRRGLFLDGERLAPSEITPVPKAGKLPENPWFEVTLHQGRNQQIRRMFHVIGHPVEKLRRIRIGFLEDARLAPGTWRLLTDREVDRFYRDYGAAERHTRKERRA